MTYIPGRECFILVTPKASLMYLKLYLDLTNSSHGLCTNFITEGLIDDIGNKNSQSRMCNNEKTKSVVMRPS